MKASLDLRSGDWALHILPPNYPRHILVLAAKLAEHSPLIVLDCGRQYDSSIVARAAHGREEIIDNIRIQRAFICSEVVKLIQQTPAGKTPILILDLLSTFCDENVKMRTRRFLLESTLFHLKRLNREAGLAVSVQMLPASHGCFYLFQHLRSSAPRVIQHALPTLNDSSRQLSFI